MILVAKVALPAETDGGKQGKWQPLSDMQPSNKGVHAAHYGTRPTIKDCVLSVSHAKG